MSYPACEGPCPPGCLSDFWASCLETRADVVTVGLRDQLRVTCCVEDNSRRLSPAGPGPPATINSEKAGRQTQNTCWQMSGPGS